MHGPHGTISIDNPTALPVALGSTYMIDTTKFVSEPPVPALASAAPGKDRGQLKGGRVTGTLRVAGSAVTMFWEILTDPGGTTSAAWEQDTNGPFGGTIAVLAGTTQPFSWMPFTADWRVRVVAGAIAPTALPSSIVVVWDRTAGV